MSHKHVFPFGQPCVCGMAQDFQADRTTRNIPISMWQDFQNAARALLDAGALGADLHQALLVVHEKWVVDYEREHYQVDKPQEGK